MYTKSWIRMREAGIKHKRMRIICRTKIGNSDHFLNLVNDNIYTSYTSLHFGQIGTPTMEFSAL